MLVEKKSMDCITTDTKYGTINETKTKYKIIKWTSSMRRTARCLYGGVGGAGMCNMVCAIVVVVLLSVIVVVGGILV